MPADRLQQISVAADDAPELPAASPRLAAGGRDGGCESADLERLLELSERLSAGREPQPIARDALAAAVAFAAADAGELWLRHAAGLERVACLGLSPAPCAAPPPWCGACVQRRAPLVLDDLERVRGGLDRAGSVHAAPLFESLGEVLGVVNLYFFTAARRLGGGSAALLERCLRLAAGPLAGAAERRRLRDELAARRDAREAAARVEAERVIRASEERYRTLFTSIDEGFCVIEVLFAGEVAADYRFLEVNPAFEKHTGLRDVAGKTMRELAPDLGARWFAIYGEVARTGEPVRFVDEALALGGRWFDVYAFKLGEGDRVAILFSDVSARVHGVAERERLVEQLREADRRKDDFIALLAHELRNPLAPIRTGLQILRLAGGDSDAAAGARAMMDRQLSHMVRLIDDLMDVSRISRNKLELRREPVQLADVVRSAVESARPALDAAGHTLEVSLPPEPVHLDADLTRLAQVFSNLLSNSAKYTPPGGSIRLDGARRGSEVVVTVRDDGLGIPADALTSIFDMFCQVDRGGQRHPGGLGVGLALVKGLVELHGGTVTAASAGEGRGSAFTVRLPASASAPAPAADPVEAEPRPRRRVLVVDDNRDGAEAMAMMLALLGDEVHTAHDGVEAVALAEELRPQVILMDIGMPRLDGLGAARQIRARPWARAVTIVALTGWGQEADRARSRAAGCDAHLVKPVSLRDLQRVLTGG